MEGDCRRSRDLHEDPVEPPAKRAAMEGGAEREQGEGKEKHIWLTADGDAPNVHMMQRFARNEALLAESNSKRSFQGNPWMVQDFFTRIGDPAASMVGSYCFPYRPPWVFGANVDGGSMQMERDYWLKDPASEGGYVVVHAHFAGTWAQPDYESVTAVNIRHTEGHTHADQIWLGSGASLSAKPGKKGRVDFHDFQSQEFGVACERFGFPCTPKNMAQTVSPWRWRENPHRFPGDMTSQVNPTDLARVLAAGEAWFNHYLQTRGPKKVPGFTLRDREVLAICIGIDEYTNATLGCLSNAVADATAVAHGFWTMAADGRYAVDVKELYNPQGAEEIIKMIEDQAPWIQQQGNALRGVVVYLSGHCVQVKDEVYLIPGGADLRNGESSVRRVCVPLSDIVETVTKAASKSHSNDAEHVTCVFIIDGCRTSLSFGSDIKISSTEKCSIPDTCDTMFMFSVGKGVAASDGGLTGHSPYTAALLKYMFKPGATLSDIQGAVAKQVGGGTDFRGTDSAGGFQLFSTPFESEAEPSAKRPKLETMDATAEPQHQLKSGPVPLEEYHQRILKEKRADKFIGRQWLLKKVKDTCISHESSPVVLILGDPGSGKSAVIVELLDRAAHPMQVWAHHFCDAHHDRTKDPAEFVKRLACLLSQRPEFLKALGSSMPSTRGKSQTVLDAMEAAKTSGSHGTKSGGTSPEALLEDFVLTPLHSMVPPAGVAVLLVDALDEGELSDGAKTIAELLNTKASRFPSWFKIVASCRLNSVTQKLRLCSEATQIIASSEDNLRDVERLIYTQLASDVQLLSPKQTSGLPVLPSELQHLVQQYVGVAESKRYIQCRLVCRSWYYIWDGVTSMILNKSDGNFLYAQTVLRQFARTHLRLGHMFTHNELKTMPDGIQQVYQWFFERQFTGSQYKESVAPMLSVILSAFEPLTREQLVDVMRAYYPVSQGTQWQTALKHLSEYTQSNVELGNQTKVEFFHASLGEWLEDSDNEYHVDRREGHAAIAVALILHLISTSLEGGASAAASQAVARFLKEESVVAVSMAGNDKDQVSCTLEMLRHLVAHCETPDKRDRAHRTRRWLALLQNIRLELECINKRGQTPAFKAAQEGHAECLRVLAEHGAGASFTVAANDGVTPALVAACEGHAECLRVLAEHGAGASFTIAWNDGVTPAFMAAQEGHAECLRVLAEHGAGASFTVAMNDGLTPALMAACEGHAECLRVLAEHGAAASFTVATNNGATPALVAAGNGHAECLRVLAEHGAGASFTVADNDGETPPFVAAQNGHAECLRVLAEHGAGASFTIAMNDGATPAFMAAQNGHAECLTVLAEHGAAACSGT